MLDLAFVVSPIADTRRVAIPIREEALWRALHPTEYSAKDVYGRAAELGVAAAERAAGLVSHLPEPYRSLYACRAALALERAAAAGARFAAPPEPYRSLYACRAALALERAAAAGARFAAPEASLPR